MNHCSHVFYYYLNKLVNAQYLSRDNLGQYHDTPVGLAFAKK